MYRNLLPTCGYERFQSSHGTGSGEFQFLPRANVVNRRITLNIVLRFGCGWSCRVLQHVHMDEGALFQVAHDWFEARAMGTPIRVEKHELVVGCAERLFGGPVSEGCRVV